MRANWMRHVVASIVACFALLLAACAQQPTKSAPVEDRTSQPPAPDPTPAKPKPKPKSVPPPKPEPKAEETVPVSVEGLEPSKVGYYFDTLQGKLRQLANPDVVVDRKDNRITLDITRREHFGNDNQATAPDGCTALVSIAKALVEYRMTHITVGTAAETNDDASRRTAKSRSDSIAQCLADAGVASRRITSSAIVGAAESVTVTLRIEPIVRAP